MLVVGPNPIFMDYISHVLPMLGEQRVEQRAIDDLAGAVSAARRDRPELARRKATSRWPGLLAEAVRTLPSPPAEMVGIRVDGAFLYLEPADVAELIAEAQESSGSHVEGRERFRMLVARRLYEQYGRKLQDLAFRSFEELEGALRTFLYRSRRPLWPRVKPEQLLRRVLAEEKLGGRLERRRRAAARRGSRAARRPARAPRTRDRRRGAGPDADAAPHARAGGRRGAMTILGDIAQAAGPIHYDRWEDLFEHLAAAGRRRSRSFVSPTAFRGR